MKILSILSITLMLTGCAGGFDPNFSAGWDAGMKAMGDGEKPPKNQLNRLVDKVVSEMLSNNQYVSKQHSIAVASIVDLDDLSTTTRLGQQVAEGIVHALHVSGYRLVDFKLTGTISVTPEGDFIHSRDWQRLKNEMDVDYLVSGTLDEYEGGAYLNVRMVGFHSQVVVASSQTFISAVQLKSFIDNPESTALSAQRVELAKEQLEFFASVEQIVEQKVEAAFNHKIDQRAKLAVDKA
ncbi:MAG: hypothetical protein HRU22_16970, partial [Gammaproteobacteria bacterium]|nr:hypothetical protein [Gammaproteobacteria bacterium]